MFAPLIVGRNRARLEASLGQSLREYSFSEVQEFESRLRDCSWSENNEPSRPLTDEEEHFIWNERLLSQIDFEYWLTRYCKVLSDEKRLVSVIPWPSQRRLLDAIAKEELRQADAPSIKIPICLLKSRQIGGTVIGEAIVAHFVFLNPRTQGFIASDDIKSHSIVLFQVLERIYDNLPGWMKPLRDVRVKAAHMHFNNLDSDIQVGAGNQRNTLGQGMNIDVAHLTEVSTWELPGGIDEDLMPAFNSSRKHHSLIILESTGAGAKGNWFHDQFMAAYRNLSTFKHVFIAWYMRPGWRLSSEGVEFSDETKKMASRVKQETGIELDREQLSWYQITRRDLEAKGKLHIFYQEYPSTVEEAFQTGLRSVFPITVRSKQRDEVKPIEAVYEVNIDKKKLRPVKKEGWLALEDEEKWDNKLLIWEPPRRGFLYVVSVDASYGIDGGDNAAVEVVRVGNKYQPDEQVAEWCGNISPAELAKVAWLVGNIYKDKSAGLEALMAVEVNPGSPGIVTQTDLMRMGYINFYQWRRPLRLDGKISVETGWWTTPSTRPLITEKLTNYIIRGDFKINSPKTIEEEASFVNTGEGGRRRHLEAYPGYHDDRLMALGIALYVAHENDIINLADERRLEEERRVHPPGKKVVQFNVTGESWSECMEKWEQSLDL